MVSTPSLRFVDAALSPAGTIPLSYAHQELQWHIRDHLLSLLADFPTLSPSAADFTHDDGTTVRLLKAAGLLPLPPPAPAVPITIWLHERYPFHPPLVFVSLPRGAAVVRDHPFVDPSGATASPYLDAWQYPTSNLSEVARELIGIFSLCPPLSSLASLSPKRDAEDRLVARVHRDLLQFQDEVEDDVEHLTRVQATLRQRATAASRGLQELEQERERMERALSEMAVDADVVSDWLAVQNRKSSSVDGGVVEGYEPADNVSKCLAENEAADLAIDDALDVLGEAMEKGVLLFEDYLKQVRRLSREQFFHRALVIKLEESTTQTGAH